MRFCDQCGNLLVPKNGKLHCKACEEEFEIDTSKPEDYKIKKSIKHDESESAPIVVKENLRRNRISGDDRKAYEDLFDIADSDTY
ncbi:MAG: hypothetical protein KAW51_08440 [Candidatus Lokiarchaeota archaeon]|nr:hypothetical protein [Candidatus Lokiarchaeota archaeon]